MITAATNTPLSLISNPNKALGIFRSADTMWVARLGAGGFRLEMTDRTTVDAIA